MISKLLSIPILLLLASTNLKLTVEDIEKIKNNRDYYEVIEATTGKEETSQFYAEDEVIKTHIEAVSALKKALANEGIDTSKVRIMLYYDPIAIRDDSPPRIWNSKFHPNTVSSPWLDLTKTITTNGETRITIRIDATAARVISDLFYKPEEKDDVGSFLSILSIRESCFLWIGNTYLNAKFNSGTLELKQIPRSFDCVPEELREPLLFLFESSHPGLGSLAEPVINQLDYYCQNIAREYYSELYPNLVTKALQIIKSESKPKSYWWTEIVKPVKQTKECQR